MTAAVEGWIELADVLTACPDRGTTDRLAAALPGLGLSRSERHGLGAAIVRRSDPAGQFLHHLVAGAPTTAEERPRVPATTDEAAMERALALADRLEAEPGLIAGLARESALPVLAALPAPRAGTLVRSLIGGRDEQAREAAVIVAEWAPMTHLPAEDLVRGAAGLSEPELDALAAVLDRAPRLRVLRSLAAALSASPSPSLARLVELLAARTRYATYGAHEGWAGAAPDEVGEDHVWRGGDPQRPAGAGPEGGAEAGTQADGGVQASGRTAYPRLDLGTGTGRPDVVVVDEPFTVTVGLGPRPSHGIVSSGALPAGEPLDVVLTYDPDSLSVEGPHRHSLVPTAERPYPTVDVTVVARYLPDPPATRRIGVYYLKGAQVVGVAWRRFVAVDELNLVESALAPPDSERTLIDLGALLGQDAPDLVLAVCRADTGAGDRWVWSTYAADPDLPVTDAPEVATLDGEVAEFATATRRAIQFSTNALADFLTLAGRAQRIGWSIPAAVHAALTAVLTAARSRGPDAPAPTVLLLTEELVIPWELGAIQPAVTTPWGGSSPFLGAHVAISRWPLTDRRPRPVPRTSVDVRTVAVVTADYSGVPGWGRLEAALAEADDVVRIFEPAALRVAPELVTVIDLLRGSPAAELLHVALHGQFDQAGEQEGLVLLDRSADGSVRPQFLTAVQIETGTLSGGPFAFLNACQVGSDEKVLGMYGGFASTLLRIGASGVVAPLWNIDDHVAADVAREVYAVVLQPSADGTPPDVSVAEAFRRVRARYTEEAVRAQTPGATATLIAFQVFGHPRLRLRRAP